MVFVYRCILRNEIINKHGFTFFMISIVSYFAHIHESKGMKLLRHTWAALLCIFFFIISIVRYFAHFIYAPSCMFSYMHVSKGMKLFRQSCFFVVLYYVFFKIIYIVSLFCIFYYCVVSLHSFRIYMYPKE